MAKAFSRPGASPEAQVIGHAETYYSADDLKFRIRRRKIFLSGTLYYLDGYGDPAIWGVQCFAHERRGHIEFFPSIEEFITWLDQFSTNSPQKFDLVSAIAGGIAFLITMTICSAFLFQHVEIPPFFGNALTVILGFYFGRSSATSQRTIDRNPHGS